MREILFRAKRIDNGEWVEGFYAQLPNPSLGASIIVNGDLCAEDVGDYIIMNRPKQHSNFSNAYPFEIIECEYYEINPETICQYTGLIDKNGNWIWENDIVLCKKYLGGNFVEYHIERGFVEMKYGAYGLHRFKPNAYYRPFKDWMEDCEYEVIGNCFDNPELLKGE